METISNQDESSKKSRINYKNDLYFKESFEETKSKVAQITKDIQNDKINFSMRCKFKKSDNFYYYDLDHKKEEIIKKEKSSFFEILSIIFI